MNEDPDKALAARAHTKHLKALRTEWQGCTRCALSASRPDDAVVVTTNAITPRPYLIVYDAPEAEDVVEGEVLSSRHGVILHNLFIEANIDEQEYAATPVVGCRPFVILPPTEDQPEGLVRERDPSPEEINACLPRLHRIIYHIDPFLIFTVGPVSWKTLVAPKDRFGTTVANSAGELTISVIPGFTRDLTYPVMPLQHPKAIVANPSSASHSPLATALDAIIRGRRYVTAQKGEHGTRR
jgi:uracil-DNA glycosylase family 4